jgi:hypothetical protein
MQVTPHSSVEALLLSRYSTKKSRTSLMKLARRFPSNEDGIQSIEEKLHLLDSIQFGLGYSVLQRYPTEFLDESAFELWSVMAAVLYTMGFSPVSIGVLFKKHPCLFASAVRCPDNVKLLFDWMRFNGLSEQDSLRIINRFPLVLQTSVDTCLEPRVSYLCEELNMPRDGVIRSIVRHPELLSVESSWIGQRIQYFRDGMGFSEDDMQLLFRAQPSAYAADVERYLVPMKAIMQEYFTFDEIGDISGEKRSLFVKSGLLSRSVDTVLCRIQSWFELGLSQDEIRLALRRFPRLLCYPVMDKKYQDKLEFLRDEMGLSPKAAIPAFPAILSYSLENRIRPRVLAIKALKGKVVTLQQMALTDQAFLKAYDTDSETYVATVRQLSEGRTALE